MVNIRAVTILALTLSIMLLVAACGGNSDPEKPQKGANAPPTEDIFAASTGRKAPDARSRTNDRTSTRATPAVRGESARERSANVSRTPVATPTSTPVLRPPTPTPLPTAIPPEFVEVWGGEFLYPAEVAVGPLGWVYVSHHNSDPGSPFNPESGLQVFTPDGQLITSITMHEYVNGQTKKNPDRWWNIPAGIAFGPNKYPDDIMYVAQSKEGGWLFSEGSPPQNSRIFEYTLNYQGSNGAQFSSWNKWPYNSTNSGKVNGLDFNPIDLAVAPDGSVYVANLSPPRIHKFTSQGEFIMSWGDEGDGEGEFKHPRGVAVAPDGSVYVVDRDSDRIQKFTSEGVFVAQWGKEGSDSGDFKKPYAIALGPDGNVYVADTGNHRIQKFTSDGGFITQWGSVGSGDGQFSGPRGVAVGLDGSIYVADTYNGRMQKFSPGS